MKDGSTEVLTIPAIVISYQACNQTYGALIRHGDLTIFSVGETPMDAVLDTINQFMDKRRQ